MNPMMSEELYTERVYIDPERLLQLKKERKAFKHVPSIFQPPPQLESTTNLTPSATNYHQSVSSPKLKQKDLFDAEIVAKANDPNVDFILSLLNEVSNQHIVWFQQGDCLSIKKEERWLVLLGQVKITGVGGRTFLLGEGNLLFINNSTIQKVRQVICVKASKMLKIAESTFSVIRNYLFLKNAQKIKYLKYCPFFIWSDVLSEDLSACMTMEIYEKGYTLFNRGDHADSIYFIKEGVILLERSGELKSTVFKDYQLHYQRSQLSATEATLVVKKGMVFGIDGILLKDGEEESVKNSRENQNPENGREQYQRRNKPTTRVYTARTIGRTQVYTLKRQILEGLFDIADLLQAKYFPRELSKHDLQRISSDYAEMVIRHRSLPRLQKTVATKHMILEKGSTPAVDEIIEKKTKVKQIRERESMARKHSIANIIADTRVNASNKMKSLNSSIVLQQHFSHKLGIIDPVDPPGLAFPRLSSNLRKKRVSKKNISRQQAQRFMIGWIKCKDPVKSRQSSQRQRRSDKQARDKQKLGLINVKSYRSIVA